MRHEGDSTARTLYWLKFPTPRPIFSSLRNFRVFGRIRNEILEYFLFENGVNADWKILPDWFLSAYPNASEAIAVIDTTGASYTVRPGDGNPLIAVASISVDSKAALRIINAGRIETVVGDLTNYGFICVDFERFTSEGGSSLTFSDTLTNNGDVGLRPDHKQAAGQRHRANRRLAVSRDHQP